RSRDEAKRNPGSLPNSPQLPLTRRPVTAPQTQQFCRPTPCGITREKERFLAESSSANGATGEKRAPDLSGHESPMPLLIEEVPPAEAPMELLLLADPSEEKLRSYLPQSRCFLASSHGLVVGACVVQALGQGRHELM